MSSHLLSRVLIIDRDERLIIRCRETLGPDIFVFGARTGEEAEHLLLSQQVDVLVSDWKLADMHLVDLLDGSRKQQPDLTLVVPYRYRNHPSLVALVGADRILPYLRRPLEPEELRARLTSDASYREAFEISIDAGHAPEITSSLRAAIEHAAPILVVAASSHSREGFARTLHRATRRGLPFARIDCTALSEVMLQEILTGRSPGGFPDWAAYYEDRHGLLERAGAGTVFVDSLDTSPQLQVALLCMFETRRLRKIGEPLLGPSIDGDLLIVAGSAVDPEAVTGQLRLDLMSRFQVVRI